MTDPDLQHLADDSAAHEQRVARARAAFAEGGYPRWDRIDGHLIDLAPPLVFPTGTLTHEQGLEIAAAVRAHDAGPLVPDPEPAPLTGEPAVERPCCKACGRPLIGGS